MAGLLLVHDESCDLDEDCSCGAGDELALALEALDSHVYWQLSEPHYRNNGHVRPPGSDVDEDAAQIARCLALEEKLRALTRPT